MVKQDVFNYVMHTRYNTNPNHLASMLTSLENAIIEDVEDNIEDHIPADKKLVDEDAEIVPDDAAGIYYTLQGTYESSTLDITSEITLEELTAWFDSGVVEIITGESDPNFISRGYDDVDSVREFTFYAIGDSAQAIYSISLEPEIG